jgi:hypothetical protein
MGGARLSVGQSDVGGQGIMGDLVGQRTNGLSVADGDAGAEQHDASWGEDRLTHDGRGEHFRDGSGAGRLGFEAFDLGGYAFGAAGCVAFALADLSDAGEFAGAGLCAHWRDSVLFAGGVRHGAVSCQLFRFYSWDSHPRRYLWREARIAPIQTWRKAIRPGAEPEQGLRTMTIQIEIKNVYGTETVYPVCRHAKFLAAMAGTKTLTADKLRLIAANGYEIEVVPASIGRLVGFAA